MTEFPGDEVMRLLTLLPACMRTSVTSECPASTARCSAVTEASCPAVIAASTDAPADSSRRTIPACPACAATCRAVTSLAAWLPLPPRMRSVARLVTSHPARMSSSTTWWCRCWATRKIDVTEPGPARSTWHWPDCSSSRVSSTWPFHAEMCSAHQPLTCTQQHQSSLGG